MIFKILAWIILVTIGGGLLLALAVAMVKNWKETLAVIASGFIVVLLLWALAELFY